MLSDDSSDSENEVLKEQQQSDSPNQSETRQKLDEAKKQIIIEKPTISYLTAVSELTAPTLVLSTDLASSTYLKHLAKVTNATPIVMITSQIKKQDVSKAQKLESSPPQQQQQQKKPIEHTYTFYMIPNTTTIIGTTSIDIPLSIANFVAEALFATFSPRQIFFYHSLNLSKVVSLLNDHDIQYPLTYNVNNYSNLLAIGSVTQSELPSFLTQNDVTILPFPQFLSLNGFPAALMTYAVLHNVPCVGTVSVLHVDYITELWLSFDKHSKLYTETIPSIYYGYEKPNKLIRNTLLKEFKEQYAKLYAHQEKVLPHTKQCGLTPKALYL